jgi:hypothetical protein
MSHIFTTSLLRNLAVAAAIGILWMYTKKPCRTSVSSGAAYVDELLHGHERPRHREDSRHRNDSVESRHHRYESREPRRRHRDDTPRPRRMIEFSPPPKFSGTDKKVLFTNWWRQVTQFLDNQPPGAIGDDRRKISWVTRALRCGTHCRSGTGTGVAARRSNQVASSSLGYTLSVRVATGVTTSAAPPVVCCGLTCTPDVYTQLVNTFNSCSPEYREWVRDAIHAALQGADPTPTEPVPAAATPFDAAIQARIVAGPRPVPAVPRDAFPPPVPVPAVCDHPDHGMSCADGACA